LRIKETIDDLEKLKEERDEYKNRLESKEREQIKIDSKMKALEKVINTNNFRTPIAPLSSGGSTSGNSNNNKENNRPQFNTPLRGGSGGTISSSGQHHYIGGTVTGTATINQNNLCNTAQSNSNDRPSTISIQKMPITSTFRSETPIASTYRSSRIVQTTTTQSIGRSYGLNSNVAQLPPQTPFKEGVPVANKRNQRRSKSAEMWLDHKPPNTAKIGIFKKINLLILLL
jgi:hypothetical protein